MAQPGLGTRLSFSRWGSLMFHLSFSQSCSENREFITAEQWGFRTSREFAQEQFAFRGSIAAQLQVAFLNLCLKKIRKCSY